MCWVVVYLIGVLGLGQGSNLVLFYSVLWVSPEYYTYPFPSFTV